MPRFRLRVRRVSPSAPPTILENPAVTSAEPGVFKVGVLLTSTPPAVDPPSALVEPRGWYSGASPIPGATTNTYLPEVGDVGASLKCLWRASVFGAFTDVFSNIIGPILAASDPLPDPGAAYDGVDPDTMARRAAIVAEFENDWPGYEGQPFESDQLASTAAQINSMFTALRDGGDATKWYRIRADSAAAASAFAADVLLKGATYNTTTGILTSAFRDWASHGGGVLIESSDPADPVIITGNPVSTQAALTINGVRGVHIRNMGAVKIATAETNAARDSATCIRIQRTGTYANFPVVRIEGCRLGSQFHTDSISPAIMLSGVGVKTSGGVEQLDLIDNRFNGYQTGVSGPGVRRFRRWGNDFQNGIGDATIVTHTLAIASGAYAYPYGVPVDPGWDERTITWTRKNTLRNLYDDRRITDQHTDMIQFGTGGDIGSYSCLVEMEASYTERMEANDTRRLTFTGIPADGATLTVSGTVFTFKTDPTLSTHIRRGSTLSATIANICAAVNAIKATVDPFLTECFNHSTSAIDVSYQQHHIGTVTTSAVASTVTITTVGGVQFCYTDDATAPYFIDVVGILNMATHTAASVGMWNGTQIFDRCTFGRPGRLVPNAEPGTDGFTYSQDDADYATSGRIAGSPAPAISHTIRNSVIGQVNDIITGARRKADGVYPGTNSVITLSGNRYPQWALADGEPTPNTLLNGPFVADAQGRAGYAFTDDGLNTQAQFRAALYTVLKLKDPTDRAAIGVTDPATWA